MVASKPPMSIFHNKELRCHSIGTSILTVYGTRASTSGTEYGTGTVTRSGFYWNSAAGGPSGGEAGQFVWVGVTVASIMFTGQTSISTLALSWYAYTNPVTYSFYAQGYSAPWTTITATSNGQYTMYVSTLITNESFTGVRGGTYYGQGGQSWTANWGAGFTATGTSGTTYLTRASTSATSYLTRASTSNTVYQTRVSTSGTTYLTRASTSNTVYYTRASTSGTTYLTRISTSATVYQTRASTSGTTYLTRASTSGYSGVSSSSQSTQSWQ